MLTIKTDSRKVVAGDTFVAKKVIPLMGTIISRKLSQMELRGLFVNMVSIP